MPLAFIEAFDPRATRLGLDDLLYWLQCYTEQAAVDPIAFAPAMRRLAELLALGINGEPDAIEGEGWYVRLGPVDLGTRIVTVQRQHRLIAAVTGAADGRLVVSGFQPLDACAIRMLTGCGVKPSPDGTVCLRPNNWEHTLDACAGMGQVYAADRGETGIGVSADGAWVPDWRRYRDAVPWPASLVAAQIAVHAAHGGLG